MALSERDHEVVHALLGLIYEAAVLPDRWESVLVGVREFVGAGSGMLALSYPRSGGGQVLAAEGLDPAAIVAWEARYGVNEWTRAALAYEVGDVRRGCDLVPTDEILESPMGRELLVPQGIVDMLGTLVAKTPCVLGSFTVYDEKVFREEAVERFSLLAPHLVRAVALHNRVSWLSERAAAFERDVERLPFAVLLVARDGEIRHANRRALALLEARDGLSRVEGRLACADREASGRLRIAIERALAPGPHREDAPGGPAVFPVRRPSGRRPYHVMVSPPSAALGAPGADPSATVWIADPEEAPVPREEALCLLLGLTSGEARLAAALASGRSLRAYAQEAGVSYETARSVLKHVLAKTGTSRQADLVRLVLTSVPPIPG